MEINKKIREHAIISEAVAINQQDIDMDCLPILKSLGCRILKARKNEISLLFHLGDEHVQGLGIVCGGIAATMLDFALTFSVLTILEEGERAMSVGLNVAYLAPVRPGPVFAEARVVIAGKRVAHTEALLKDEKGTLLASAQSPISIKRFG
ncbi:hypothetical protein MNBD_ALPHA04-1739 [hydrothermal vent metagenome]|uniref:Thioesterase domain-containing protein n=1 Tax=hydrothermal vent metagenome TaxID=652676 RepID=A0A3B0R728_9ZZZZ